MKYPRLSCNLELMKKTSGMYIYGRKPIEEALLSDPKNVKMIYVRENIKEAELDELRKYLSKYKIPISKTTANKLEGFVGDVNDQGIVAELAEFKSVDIHDWLENLNKDENPLTFVLDELEDPHNVGAIIRTAAASGAVGVILSKHRQAPINATVFKTSAGAVLKMPIIVVSNTNDAINKLQKAGFWVAGLDSSAKKNIWDEKYDSPMAIVIGNEGKGIREKTQEACDYLLKIPMERNVESLNASVSAAVVAYEWKRKNHGRN